MKWFFRPGRGNEALLRDLRRLVSGKVLGDEISRIVYSASPCSYSVKPLVIVQPKEKMDVVKVVKYVASRGIGITARGSGTSPSGNSVGEGILLDFCPFMNQILEFEPEEETVWVQPGLLLSTLNRFLRPHGFFFPIDPGSGEYCTLGGMIANNASGSHSPTYGATGDFVCDLEVVLSNGEVIPTGPLSLRGREMRELIGAQTLEGEIYRALPDLLKRHNRALKSERPLVSINSAGYDLWRIKKGRFIDLTPLFVGSEGTLGIITEAKLRLSPLPGKSLYVLVFLDDLDQVSPAIEELLALSAGMVKILERSILDFSKGLLREFEPYLLEGTKALLVLEFEGGRAAEIEEGLSRLLQRLGTRFEPWIARDDREEALFEKVKNIPMRLAGEWKGPKPLVSLLEAEAVHPGKLSAYLKGLRSILERERIEAIIDGNGGDGTLHVRVPLDRASEDDVKRMSSLRDACYDLILALKGTITLRHGDGRFKAPYLKKQYPTLYPAMEEVKGLFDRRNILNPSCIVGEGAKNLALEPKIEPLPLGREQGKGLLADPMIRKRIDGCTGCGKCRAFCPIARILREEWSTVRGKVTLLKEIEYGPFDWSRDERFSFRRVMEHCLNCGQCLKECPMKVNGAWIALQGRALPVRKHGIAFGPPLLDSRFSWRLTEVLSNLGKGMAPHSLPRTLLEKVVGLDRRRYLPETKKPRRVPRARAGPISGHGKRVVYISNDSPGFKSSGEEAQGTLDVLQRNGFDVVLLEIKDFPWPCAHERSICHTRETMERVVSVLYPFVSEGLRIVFSEPRIGLAIKLVFPKVLGSERALLVSEQCYDIHRFLLELYDRGELCLEFGEIETTLGYHHACHLRALGVGEEPLALLGLVPGLKVRAFSEHCCGMGGTFGMMREHFDLSMAIGEPLFKAIKEMKPREVATSCEACRLQIFQGTGKRAVHPISLLALAYERKDGGSSLLSFSNSSSAVESLSPWGRS